MKKIILLTFFITNCYCLYSQDIAIKKKFFTTENFRLGAILAGDFSFAGNNGKTILINQNGSIDKENIRFANAPNTTYFLGFDAYSPTSTLGFMTGIGINLQEFSVKNVNGTVSDSIKTTNIEIPVYAKFRIGNVIKGGQFWIALGGGYSFVSKAEILRVNNTSNILTNFDAKESFKSNPFISSIIGYEFLLTDKDKEFLNRDTFRILLYSKFNYDLGNRIEQNNQTNSTFNSYNNPSIEFFRISFGIKILVRLTKAGEILNEATKSQFQK